MPRGKRADSRPEVAEGGNAPLQASLIDVAPEATASAPEPLPSRDSSPDGSDRVSVKLIDGKFDRDGLRAKTAEKFQQALKSSMADPDFRKWAGLESVPMSAIDEAFKPEQFGILLDTLVMLEVSFMTAKTALPQETVKGILTWSPEEHAIIDQQGARIICRYCPAEWLSKADIFIFIITLISFTVAKMKKVNDLAAAQLEAIGKAKRAQPENAEPQQEKAA